MTKSKSKEELFIEALLQCSNLKQFRNGTDEQLATKVLADILRCNSKKNKNSRKKLNQTDSNSFCPELYSEKYLTPKRTVGLNNKKQINTPVPKNIPPTNNLDNYFAEFILNEDSNTNPEKLKQIRQAENALRQLSPGKKALLESLFNNHNKVSIKELASQLNEPEEKIIKLKDEALRSLIYKIT